MPRVIPKGGKRLIQVKVNLNEPEKETLDKLVKYFGSDSSRTLRQLLINWNDLEKYVVSLDEIISKVRDICLNNEDNLPSQILEKFQFLIESAKFLSEESSESDKFTKRKFLDKKTRDEYFPGSQIEISAKFEDAHSRISKQQKTKYYKEMLRFLRSEYEFKTPL